MGEGNLFFSNCIFLFCFRLGLGIGIVDISVLV